MSAEAEDPRDAYWKSLDDGSCASSAAPLAAMPGCRRARNARAAGRRTGIWEEASGEARVVSWVVFHTAFDEAFKERVPYNVAVVELKEGPRLVHEPDRAGRPGRHRRPALRAVDRARS